MDGRPVNDLSTDLSKILKSNLIYNRQDLQWYSTFNRFGFLDPYTGLSQSKEYLFFTKPDCHIFTPGTSTLQPMLKNNTFFADMSYRYPYVLQQLQRSAGSDGSVNDADIVKNPFMVLLSNSVKNSMDLQALTASEMDGPTNQFGTSINYRKDAWTGDENVEFSLEFEDSRFLEVYLLTKAYEEYERYKTSGQIYPPNIEKAPEFGTAKHNCNKYISNKELHDTFGIYRIIVGEDYETILYWAYVCGCYIASVPRDAFNDIKNGEGLRYTVDFKGFYVYDMDPLILANFNKLIMDAYGDQSSNRARLPIYGIKNPTSDYGTDNANLKEESNSSINGSWARYPMVAKIQGAGKSSSYWDTIAPSGMRYTYQLHWFV